MFNNIICAEYYITHNSVQKTTLPRRSAENYKTQDAVQTIPPIRVAVSKTIN